MGRRELPADVESEVRHLIAQNLELLRTLSEITEFPKAYRTLSAASGGQLGLIGYLCHLTTNGVISMTSANHAYLRSRRRLGRLESQFQSELRFNEFEDATRAQKLVMLMNVGIGVSVSLRSIFFLPPSIKAARSKKAN